MKSTSTFSLLLVFSVFFFSSCVTYQYTTIGSNLPQSEHNDFFFENDTLQIIYSFEGLNCPLQIEIINKLNKPLFINWDQSAIVLNGKTSSLKQNISTFSSSTHSTSTQITSNTVHTDGYQQGIIKHPNRDGFIPPNAQLNIESTYLHRTFINTQDADSTESINLYKQSSTTPSRIKKHYFSANNSPLHFRCFISYSANASDDKPHVADYDFWAASVFKTNSAAVYPRKNQFYTSKMSQFGGFMIGASAIGIIAIVASIDFDVDPNN